MLQLGMIQTCPLFLCASLLLLLLPFQATAQQQGPFVLTKYVNFVDEVELGIMTMPEYQERHKIVRQEQHVFDLALRAAATEWAKENTISFPRIFSKPEFSRIRVYPKQADGMKQMQKLQQAENQRIAIRERNEANENKKGGGKKKGGRNNRNRSTKTDMEKLYKQQREARTKAKSVVRDQMDEFMGKLNSAHTGRMRPEDVFSAGRPK